MGSLHMLLGSIRRRGIEQYCLESYTCLTYSSYLSITPRISISMQLNRITRYLLHLLFLSKSWANNFLVSVKYLNSCPVNQIKVISRYHKSRIIIVKRAVNGVLDLSGHSNLTNIIRNQILIRICIPLRIAEEKENHTLLLLFIVNRNHNS